MGAPILGVLSFYPANQAKALANEFFGLAHLHHAAESSDGGNNRLNIGARLTQMGLQRVDTDHVGGGFTSVLPPARRLHIGGNL